MKQAMCNVNTVVVSLKWFISFFGIKGSTNLCITPKHEFHYYQLLTGAAFFH